MGCFFAKLQLSPIWVQLKLPATDGKSCNTDRANAKALLRIIQSIPSPKAEPFKQWLAQVGYERLQEIENPELAQERMKELYEKKGYPKDWIDKRATLSIPIFCFKLNKNIYYCSYLQQQYSPSKQRFGKWSKSW